MDKDVIEFTKACTIQVLHMRQSARMDIFSGKDCNSELHQKLIALEIEERADCKEQYDFADNIIDVMIYELGFYIDACSSKDDLDMLLEKEDSPFYSSCIKAMEELSVIGCEPFHCFKLVHESNMSKLCHINEVNGTIEKYGAGNIEMVEIERRLFSVFAASEFIFEGELIPHGKWLKSTGYKKPNWTGDQWWKL